MKVAMIGHKVVPSRRGGIENVLTTLCPLLADMDVKVTCYNRSSDKVEEDYIDAVQGKKYGKVRLKKAWTINARGLSAMISSFTAAISAAFGNYDIVHFHAEGPCAAMWIPKMFGKRCVATVHGLDWQREKWGKGFASKYIKFGERVMVKYANEIIVLSESAREYFKTTYNRETILIPNGIDKPEKKNLNEIAKLYGLSKDGYICIVSRLTAEKGIHYLIDAYNKIKTNKKLVIVGDTSDTDDYVELLKQKAADNPNIIFTGFMSGDKLAEIYSNAYFMALPSDLEGMSLSLLEALAYGNAVLCSDIRENTLVTEDRAMLFKKGNVDDLAEKMQIMCNDPQLVKSMRNGVDEFILRKYNWSDIASHTYNLYKKLCIPKRKALYRMKKKEKSSKKVRVLKFFLISLIFAIIAVSTAVFGCNYISNRKFHETFYSVSSLKVNNKIRIIQISDLHDCVYGKDNAKLIDRIAKLDPDLIILTGDCLDTHSRSTDRVASLCSELVKIAPSYYIYGNNEVEKYYNYPLTQKALDKHFGFVNDDRDPQMLLDIRDPLIDVLEASGVVVLKNSADTITIGLTNVDIYGVLTSNPSSFWSYAGESFDEFIYTNETNLKIMAVHEPMIFEEYSPDSWGDIMLAGHTHGGIVKIPMIGALYTSEGGFLPERSGHYVYGRYEVQGRPLIVSGGLENKNIFRTNNPPEIVIIDINKF